MFIYNIFPASFEITAIQGIIVFIFLISAFILCVLLTKTRPNKKIIIISVIIGIFISFVTLSIGNGIESGFASKMGWPLYFIRNFKALDYTDLNFIIDPKYQWYFLVERFVLNSSIFIFTILNLTWFFSLRNTLKSLKIHILPLLTLFALLILSLSCLTNVLEENSKRSLNLKLADDDTEQKLEPRARYLIENKYPEFKDFEKQESFAGKVVFSKIVGNSIYFAYVVEGSGVPIADATCFKVENLTTVSEIGKLKRPLPGNDGTIDPVTCIVN